MRLRAEKNKLKIEHSIIDGLRPVLERLLRANPEIRSVIPGVIRQVRDARGTPTIHVTVPTKNGWKAIALSAGQSEGIDRLYATYPELHDDAFVAANLERWRN